MMFFDELTIKKTTAI